MKTFNTLLIASLSVLVVNASFNLERPNPEPVKPKTHAERMYEAITFYADSFKVPINIAFNVAYMETTYRGPHDTLYVHNKTSKAGAVGPMQIMPQYASHYAGFNVTKKQLRDSLELNVMISMKILSSNYRKTKNWMRALGKYNTGKPCVNRYAKKGVVKNYKKNWVLPKLNNEIDLVDLTK